MEEPGERQKRLIRIEEQKTRSTRILYTLSQKLREIDVAVARRPKPAKRVSCGSLILGLIIVAVLLYLLVYT